MSRDVVAIDGPSGAGKTTVAKEVARRLDYRCLETGAIYRALTLVAMEHGIPAGDAARLSQLASQLGTGLELSVPGTATRVAYRGRDITEALRRPAVEAQVSQVAAHPSVRQALVGVQRQLAARGRMVMEGRDIGTVVVPDARYKFFLTASLDERVERRYRQLRSEGMAIARERVRQELRRRDERDASRRAAPLKAAQDAVVLDTTGCTMEQVVEAMISQVRSPRLEQDG